MFAAILFIVAGFAFKVSAVPFQFWAPDTYEGSPVPVAAFLAVASSAAGFAGLLQLMFVAFPAQAHFWTPIFAALSIATMTLGNLVALQQRQVVRLLAYSGIAQTGYILLAVRARRRLGVGRPGRVLGRRHLHPDLRRDDPGRVRRDDRREPAFPRPADLATSPAWCGARRSWPSA